MLNITLSIMLYPVLLFDSDVSRNNHVMLQKCQLKARSYRVQSPVLFVQQRYTTAWQT